MEILFIIDDVKDLERKISRFDVLGANIKFFVSSKYAGQLISNKQIVNNIVAIYKNNVNVTIDKYIKSASYKPQETILYYSSAELTNEIVDKFRENLKLKPDTIYVKKRFNWWQKFKLWFYKNIIRLIFGVEDEYASIKLQHFSQQAMQVFMETSFKNHIFSVSNALSIELDKDKEASYYNKPKADKNCLYNPIVICLILICYVVLEKLFVLPFWVYFLVVALILAVIVNWITMTIKNNFDIRYRK